jgi:hypothetical protein
MDVNENKPTRGGEEVSPVYAYIGKGGLSRSREEDNDGRKNANEE